MVFFPPFPAVPFLPWPPGFGVRCLFAAPALPRCTLPFRMLCLFSFRSVRWVGFWPWIVAAWPGRDPALPSPAHSSRCRVCACGTWSSLLHPKAGEGEGPCTAAQRLLARFRLWISSPSPLSSVKRTLPCCFKFHLHYSEWLTLQRKGRWNCLCVVFGAQAPGRLSRQVCDTPRGAAAVSWGMLQPRGEQN